MFFSSRKNKKLAEEAQQKEQERLKQEEALLEVRAYAANLEKFYRICDMVRSLPKKRQIVVVQRKNTFTDKSAKNWYYLNLAKDMRRYHRIHGKKWIASNDNSLYAFYAPTKVDYEFRAALREFSKDGYIIQRIRYYHFDY